MINKVKWLKHVLKIKKKTNVKNGACHANFPCWWKNPLAQHDAATVIFQRDDVLSMMRGGRFASHMLSLMAWELVWFPLTTAPSSTFREMSICVTVHPSVHMLQMQGLILVKKKLMTGFALRPVNELQVNVESSAWLSLVGAELAVGGLINFKINSNSFFHLFNFINL